MPATLHIKILVGKADYVYSGIIKHQSYRLLYIFHFVLCNTPVNTKFLTCTFKSIPSVSPVALAAEGSVIVSTGSISITCVCSSSAFINIYTAKERKMERRKKVLYLTI